MSENSGKKLAIVAVVIAAGMFFAGIGTGYAVFSGTTPGSNTQITTLRIAGSTTVFPIATTAADAFMALYPLYDVIVGAGGSTVGVTDVGNDISDIGMSSREVKASEIVTYPTLNITAIAKDGLAIVVNPSLGITPNFTIKQVKMIYNGTITNWNYFLGGPDHEIDVYGRESASGTRGTFEDLVMKSDSSSFIYKTTLVEVSGSAQMNSSVAMNQHGIGYIGIGFVNSNPSISAVNIAKNSTSAAIACTVANVLSRAYPLSRNLYMITKGSMSVAELSFISFILGPTGQRIVEDEGFVPLY